MAIVAFYGFKILSGKTNKVVSRVVSGIAAEIVMILGYLLFEGILYGFVPSLVNIPPNAVQGLAGIIIGVILINIFNKYKILK